MTIRTRTGLLLAVGLTLSPATAPATAQVFQTDKARVRVVEVAAGFEHPWSLAFLPDGDMLVTEREGRLRRVAKDGTVSAPIAGVPRVHARGQGGLLDVVLAPRFAENRLVYLSYSEPGEGGSGTAVARGRLDGDALRDVQVIFRQRPKLGTNHHYGSRLVFAPDGTLFVTMGDRGHKERAQDLSVHQGKLARVNPDGSIPRDNPFVGKGGALPEIWSLGHRNIQGATLHPATGALWTHEHGARGGDEINVPRPGLNYGWPVITYGIDYSGEAIGVGTHKEGMEQPLRHWDPSIAPSGMAFYTGDRFPGWKDDLFIGSLKFGLLVRLDMEGERVVGEERLLEDVGERVRDVRQGPDGLLYLLTDHSGGRLLRLEPAG